MCSMAPLSALCLGTRNFPMCTFRHECNAKSHYSAEVHERHPHNQIFDFAAIIFALVTTVGYIKDYLILLNYTSKVGFYSAGFIYAAYIESMNKVYRFLTFLAAEEKKKASHTEKKSTS